MGYALHRRISNKTKFALSVNITIATLFLHSFQYAHISSKHRRINFEQSIMSGPAFDAINQKRTKIATELNDLETKVRRCTLLLFVLHKESHV